MWAPEEGIPYLISVSLFENQEIPCPIDLNKRDRTEDDNSFNFTFGFPNNDTVYGWFSHDEKAYILDDMGCCRYRIVESFKTWKELIDYLKRGPAGTTSDEWERFCCYYSDGTRVFCEDSQKQ
jgi:hypothetical protein